MPGHEEIWLVWGGTCTFKRPPESNLNLNTARVGNLDSGIRCSWISNSGPFFWKKNTNNVELSSYDLSFFLTKKVELKKKPTGKTILVIRLLLNKCVALFLWVFCGFYFIIYTCKFPKYWELPWWPSGWDSELLVQGPWVQSQARALDPTGQN